MRSSPTHIPQSAVVIMIALALQVSSCTLTMDYDQCMVDSDCPADPATPTPQFCTSDHICINATPVERLCTQTYPASPSPNAIQFGALLNLPKTGPSDQGRLQAMQLAIDEINDLASLNVVRPVAVHICDTSGAAVDAPNSMRLLATNFNVAGVLGPTTDDAFQSVIGVAAAVQVPLVSPSVTGLAVAMLPGQGFAYRMVPVDVLQAPSMAQVVTDQKQVTLVLVTNSYGEDVSQAFQTAWFGKNITNQMKLSTFNYIPNRPDAVKSIAGRILGSSPDFVVLVPGDDGADFVAQLQGLPIVPGDSTRTTQIILSDSAHNTALLDLAKTAKPTDPNDKLTQHLSRIQGFGPLTFGAAGAVSQFKTSYAARFPLYPLDGDIFIAYTYDAFYTLAVAAGNLKKDNATPGVDVANILRLMTGSKTLLQIGPAAYNGTVRTVGSGMPFTLSGITGTIGFNENGDRNPTQLEKWTLNPAKGAFTSAPLQ